jgi:hypothetical protein
MLCGSVAQAADRLGYTVIWAPSIAIRLRHIDRRAPSRPRILRH